VRQATAFELDLAALHDIFNPDAEYPGLRVSNGVCYPVEHNKDTAEAAPQIKPVGTCPTCSNYSPKLSICLVGGFRVDPSICIMPKHYVAKSVTK
jgi:hypothetical protein